MAWPNDNPAPANTPIGIHGSIKLGLAADALTAYDASSGTFTPTLTTIKKPSTLRRVTRSEAGLIDATISVNLNVDAANPPPFKIGDIIHFEFGVLGRYTYTGNFLAKESPDSFTADGDATYSLSGEVQEFTRTLNPSGA